MHTGGEPLRIPIEGLPEIHGTSILEKRKYFKENHDSIRTGLLFEPRGHADMYGAIISEATSAEADFDVFFIHNEGYSTMCGHAVIALTRFASDYGLIPKDKQQIVMNTPAGLVTANKGSGTHSSLSSFVNVPSFVYLENERIDVDGLGEVRFDIAYGGAFYALVEADSIGLKLSQEQFSILIRAGRAIKNAIMEKFDIIHPVEPDLGFLYGTIFTGPAKDSANHSRNVCIFAEGELDRSPTGTGVSARSALHFKRGEIEQNEFITIESILGSTMDVRVTETVSYHGLYAVIPEVRSAAYYLGENTMVFEPGDPFKEGFIFR